jgi:molybdopterin-guanine dinucleotide biosynthesis protein A
VVLQAPLLSVGFAVAGGQSLRMGRDKALLPWGASTLLDHTLDRLRAACSEVRILSGAELRYTDRGLPVLADSFPGGGPLAGVCAGLGSSGNRIGLFLAVDLPFVPAALLLRLLELAEGADAAVPVSEDGTQPLCAAYGPACLGPIRHRLQAGERKMTCFWPDVRVKRVGSAELSAFGDPAAVFRNLNTLDDYEGAAPR